MEESLCGLQVTPWSHKINQSRANEVLQKVWSWRPKIWVSNGPEGARSLAVGFAGSCVLGS